MKTYQSINAAVVKAVSPVIPVAHLDYPDGGTEYATFEITASRSVQYASGSNHAILCHGYLDVFTDYDPTGACPLLEQLDVALDQAGFSVQSIGNTRYFHEMHKYHTEVTFEGMISLGEEEHG